MAFPIHNTYTFISLQFRDFLRRVSSSKLRETNPKCKITSVITCDYSVPTVDVTFSALHRERGMVHTVCISGFHTEHWEFFLPAHISPQKLLESMCLTSSSNATEPP